MGISAASIAEMVGGTIKGDGDVSLEGVAGFDNAGPQDITYAGSAAYMKRLGETKAAAILVAPNAPGDSGEIDCYGKILILVARPDVAFARISAAFHPAARPIEGISPSALMGQRFNCGDDVSICPGVVIGDDVVIGRGVILYPGVVLGNKVRIGDEVVLYPNVSILERCEIGSRVIIHAGTVVGSDGYGFAFDGKKHHKIPQIGIVQIDDDVELGACNTVDRATFGKTWIKRGVKTDNMVHIAHNVEVGEHTLLVAQVALGGSVTVGNYAVLAGQVAVAEHVEIGNRVMIGGKSGVGKSIPDGEIVSGSPAIPHRVWLRASNVIPKLPDMSKKIHEMEKRIEELEKALTAGQREREV